MVGQPDPPGRENQIDAEEGFVPTRAPRWVKVFGLVVLGLAVVFMVVQLATGGEHGPGRHGGGDEEVPEAVVRNQDHVPPVGVGHGG